MIIPFSEMPHSKKKILMKLGSTKMGVVHMDSLKLKRLV
jgi:hypothetical protein